MEAYQERVIEEKKNLEGKIKDLQTFLETKSKLVNSPHELKDLSEQLHIMEAYRNVLSRRVNRF